MATTHHVQAPGGWAHAATHHGDGSNGFGEWLAQAREARGLTLDDISRETKIPLRNLEALEHGNLGVIPEFYQRAEVRAIARAVGIDERLAMGRLDTAITPALEARPERQEEVARPGRKSTVALVVGALALGAMLAAAGVGRAVFGGAAPPQRAVNPGESAGSAAATQSGTAAAPEGQGELVVLPAQEAAAAEPPAAPETAAAVWSPASTEIVVTTDPPGAVVTVNGISWGESPVTIRHLSPGAKRIRATKEGFAAAEQVLHLAERQQRTLNLRLSGAE